jgi:hypothetical protein
MRLLLILCAVGVALRAQGRAAEALAEFKESVRLDPGRRPRHARPAVASNSMGPM